MCFIFCTIFVANIFFSDTYSANSVQVKLKMLSHVKCSSVLFNFYPEFYWISKFQLNFLIWSFMEIFSAIPDLFHASKYIWIDRLVWICTSQGHEHKQKWNIGTEYYIRCMFAYAGCYRRSWRQGSKNDEFISITLPKWKSRSFFYAKKLDFSCEL